MSRRGGRRRSTLAAVAALVLSGCAAFQARPPAADPAPGAAVPDAWTAPDGGLLAAVPRGPEPWWAAFEDPALSALVEEALGASFDLQAAAARLAAAEAQARIAGAELRPRVDGSLSAARNRRNFIGFPIPGSEEQVLSTTNTNLGVSLDVSWELDLWGRVRAGREAAAAQAAAVEADLAGAALSLAGQTAKAWFGAVEARRQTTLAAAALESRELTTRQVRRRYEAGVREALDLRLARSEEAVARSTLEARRQALDALERQLEVLVGRYPARELEVTGGLATPPPVPTGVPSEIVTRRPDLAAAEARLAAAGFEVAAARAALYPRVSLTGSAGRSSEELEDLLDDDFTVWSIAGNLLQPILQGGRLRAGVDLARASQAEATALYAGEVLEAFREVETSLGADSYLAARGSALETAAAEARAALALAEERYRLGLQDFLSVLEAQRRLYDAESLLLEVRRARLDARVDLILALGGGFAKEASSEGYSEGDHPS
jgi:NodT family efflux transporter outer membrane factor (OMF) lipoprotein